MTHQLGIYSTVDSDVYHADEALSFSGAKMLLHPSCPALYRHWRDQPRKPKRAWDFGTLAHTLVLGKGMDQVVVIDAPDYRTKAAQQQRDDAYARNRSPVLIAEVKKAEAMADAVLSHPLAAPLFAPGGMAEHSIWWTDEQTGVRLRCRPDWITADGGTLVDYKTAVSANPSVAQRKWVDYGYHIQHAFYTAGFMAATGSDEPDFVFVAQEKDAPYLVQPIRYDDEALAEGRRLMREAIDLFAECQASGVWPGYADDIALIGLPAWALPEMEMGI